MSSKLADNLLLSTMKDVSTTPLPTGSHNAAMFEVWLKSSNPATLTNNIDVALEGSNDQINWSSISGLSTLMDTTSPDYKAVQSTATTIPFQYLRLTFGGMATNEKALMDGVVRLYTNS